MNSSMHQPGASTSARERTLQYAEQAFPFVLAAFIAATSFAKAVASIAHSVCIILFILVLALRRDHGWVTKARTYYRIILAYCALLVLSLLYSADAAAGAPEVWRQVTRLTTPVMIIEMVSREKDARRYLYAFIAGGTLLAGIGIFEAVVQDVSRPPSMWHPVHGANILMFGLIGSAVLAAFQRPHRVFLVLASILIAYAVYLTGTRGVWIAVALVLILLPFLHPALTVARKLAFAGIVAFVLIIVSLTPLVQEGAQKAVSEIHEYQQLGQSTPSASLAKRFDMWKASFLMFKEHLLFGVGTGGWKRSLMEIVRDRLVPESITEYGNPHNIFIEALSSRGIIGLLAVLALIGFPLYLAVAAGSKPETRTYTTLVFCVSFAFIISGQTDTLVIIRGVFASYLIMVGLSLAVILRPVISDTAGAR